MCLDIHCDHLAMVLTNFLVIEISETNGDRRETLPQYNLFMGTLVVQGRNIDLWSL